MVLFPFPLLRSTRGFLSDIYCENPVSLVEVKLTKVWAFLLPWVGSPGVFNSQTSLHRASSNLVSYRFSYPSAGSCGFHSWVSADVSRASLYSPVRFSSFGLPCVLTSYGSKKSCWFFSLFNSFLLVSMEWWLASSLRVEPQTESPSDSLRRIESLYSLFLYDVEIFSFFGTKGPIFFSLIRQDW